MLGVGVGAGTADRDDTAGRATLTVSQAKIDAMPVQYKCFDCGGVKTFGMAPFSKAAVGFLGQTFSFCSACGKWLEEKDRATDKEKIVE